MVASIAPQAVPSPAEHHERAAVAALCALPGRVRPFTSEHPGMDAETAPASPDTPISPAPLSLAAASAACGVSQVTLRKHLAAGRVPGVKVDGGRHGATWQIDPADLAAFVGSRYGRPIDLAGLPAAAPQSSPRKQADTESMAELRGRLEATLIELGKYKALTEASEAADTRVESILTARIAELQRERDTAKREAEEAAAEFERLRSRGFWGRLFGGK